jgi:hypothetical protein
MSGRRWIPTMLKARQAAEDVAAQHAAVAQRASDLAEQDVLTETSRIESMQIAGSESAQAFLASTAARQAAAATHAASVHRAAFARTRHALKVDELTAASRGRRSVEKLAERELEEQRATALGRAQRELDDQTVTRHKHSELRRSG